jgi:tetratricopeptide (TPR) repeat protein
MPLLLATLSLAGCAINPPLDLSKITAADALQLPGVPFYPQTEYECGPAALAGLLGAAGVDTTPQSLSAQVYLPGRQGSLQVELVSATRRAGRIPYMVDARPQALVAELEEGRPVLVLQNMQTRDFPIWHYAVLVGLDTRTNRVYLNSAAEQAMPLAAPEFLRTWDWGGRWALVALRPGELPAGVDMARYISAVASFEQVAGYAAAVPAWQRALQQWPQDAMPYLALGNAAHASGNLQEAADYYHRGLHFNKEQSALTNNLAVVLGEAGCPRAGEALLRPIADRQSSDSRWGPALLATMAELAGQGGQDGPSCEAFSSGF